jgi:hypothetical protein
MKMQERSIAMPFLSAPPALDGTMAGDVGFDPLGFSNYFDLKWLREAELKHGRICMLGCLGFLTQEKVCIHAQLRGRSVAFVADGHSRESPRQAACGAPEGERDEMGGERFLEMGGSSSCGYERERAAD